MAQRKDGTRWTSIIEQVAKDVRIKSKEIVSDDPRGAPLVLWDSQKRLLREIGEGLDLGIHNFVIAKSRQLGVTSITLLIDMVWLAFHNDMTCALVTENEKNRDKNRLLLRNYIESLPEGYFGDEFYIVKGGDNRASMRFSNGSRVDFLVAGTREKGTSWGEGEGYTQAHMTERAAYGSPDGIASFEESFAQSNPHRLFISESTSKGHNHWKRTWDAAVEDVLSTRAIFIGWWAGDHNRIERSDPRYLQYGTYAASGEEREKVATVVHRYNHKITPEQLAWIRWRDANADDDQMMKQNQPWLPEESFIVSGYSFFQVRQLGKEMSAMDEADKAANKAGEVSEYAFIGYRYDLGSRFFDMRLVQVKASEGGSIDDVELRVWEEPKDNGKYVIGCDPAWGRNDHKDRHALSVWRCFADRLVQVAEYATNDVEPKHFAWVIAHMAGVYKDCIVNVEINGPGRMIMQEWEHIRGLLNADMYSEEVKARSPDWEDALGNARWYLYRRIDQMGAGYCANFETNWKTKQEIMFQYRGEYVTGALKIRSRKLLEEMVNVIHDDGEIGAPESRAEDSKDDRVFAGALANRAWLNWQRPSMIFAGETYDMVTRTERGEKPNQSQRTMSYVHSWLRRRDEIANDPEMREVLTMSPNQRFLKDRGL